MVSNKVIMQYDVSLAACVHCLMLILIILQDQYQFCHQVLADFLDEFDTYANFKKIIWKTTTK